MVGQCFIMDICLGSMYPGLLVRKLVKSLLSGTNGTDEQIMASDIK